MKEKIRTIIIDSNSEVVCDLKSHFEVSNSVVVINSFANGEEALGYLIANENNFDLIIMDLIIPKLDGMAILEELQKRSINKKIIILSSFKDENLIYDCSKYGISYYLLKPISINSLDKRIMDIFNIKPNLRAQKENTDLEVSKLLHNLGIPSHIRGYKYIRDGIMIICSNDDNISMITKEIYPQIAIKYETTPSRVERAIRHAVEVSWMRGDINLMDEIFGYSVSCEKSKPTNSEFLKTVAERIKLTNGYK